MASIIQLTTDRVREIASLILCFVKSQVEKDHPLKVFMAIGGYFVLGSACVMVLGWLKKRKLMKLDFRHFQVCLFNNTFEQIFVYLMYILNHLSQHIRSPSRILNVCMGLTHGNYMYVCLYQNG